MPAGTADTWHRAHLQCGLILFDHISPCLSCPIPQQRWEVQRHDIISLYKRAICALKPLWLWVNVKHLLSAHAVENYKATIRQIQHSTVNPSAKSCLPWLCEEFSASLHNCSSHFKTLSLSLAYRRLLPCIGRSRLFQLVILKQSRPVIVEALTQCVDHVLVEHTDTWPLLLHLLPLKGLSNARIPYRPLKEDNKPSRFSEFDREKEAYLQ